MTTSYDQRHVLQHVKESHDEKSSLWEIIHLIGDHISGASTPCHDDKHWNENSSDELGNEISTKTSNNKQ